MVDQGGQVEHANPGLALQYADAVISLDSEWALAYAWRGTLLYKLARYEAALQDLENCRKRDPSYRPDKLNDLIKEVERALAESQKI